MTNLNDVAKQITEELVKSIYLSLDETWNKLGEDTALLVNDTLIAELIGFMVYQELSSSPTRQMKKSERQAFTEANYMAVKQRVQECVATGFEAATRQFSGVNTQYYCQVKRIPPADKDKLC